MIVFTGVTIVIFYCVLLKLTVLQLNLTVDTSSFGISDLLCVIFLLPFVWLEYYFILKNKIFLSLR